MTNQSAEVVPPANRRQNRGAKRSEPSHGPVVNRTLEGLGAFPSPRN